MKYIWIGGPLALGYLVFQVFALGAIFEMWSSKKECDDTILTTLKSAHSATPSKVTKDIEAGCFRMQANAEIADRVLKAVP